MDNVNDHLKERLIEPKYEQVEQTGLDLSQCPQEILYYVAALAALQPKEKPKVADVEVLVFDDNGGTEKLKPKSDELTKAYEFYMSLLTKPEKRIEEAKTEQPLNEKAFLVFTAPHGRYSKGDRACFNAKDAKRYLNLKPSVAHKYDPNGESEQTD
ncbi:hypothetical protein [Pseudoalteromonas sp. S16_S37]|uniref:hypothetical protein n=1 Tax=Pseudoalteromonas sp. S16_S37 TaxID=2720228 RepID=UPI0016808919|nr:hypothetical protein [Pseudoalteromonas sp. S16_S37]MBD1583494.1 hypothetical protein [Pseudoalteromonas sp. S16_S37]